MKLAGIIPVSIALAMTASCSRSDPWPPNQAELTRVFGQQKRTFIVIEEQMIEDGLQRMGPAIDADTDRSPAVPTMSPGQTEKYAALFDSTQIYLDVTRSGESTSFEILLQSVGPRLYPSRFVHTTTNYGLPDCASAMQRLACGTCSIRLESDWLLEYNWFPADPDVEAREC